MVRRVAVACTLTLALSAGASAQSGSSGTSTAQNPSGTQTTSLSQDATSDTRPDPELVELHGGDGSRPSTNCRYCGRPTRAAVV